LEEGNRKNMMEERERLDSKYRDSLESIKNKYNKLNEIQ
jgi:hypothetical protein